MRYWKKALLAIVLSIVMLTGEMVPIAGAWAETNAPETQTVASQAPAAIETEKPSEEPAVVETEKPSEAPVVVETEKPSEAPVVVETEKPSETPVAVETEKPSEEQTNAPQATPVPEAEPDAPVRIEKIAFRKDVVEILLSEYAEGRDLSKVNINAIEITPENAVRESAVWTVRKSAGGPEDDSIAAFVDYDRNGEKLEGNYSEEDIAQTRFEVYQAGEVYIRVALRSDPSIYGEFKLVIKEDAQEETPVSQEQEESVEGELPSEELIEQNELGNSDEPVEGEEGEQEQEEPAEGELPSEELVEQNELGNSDEPVEGEEGEQEQEEPVEGELPSEEVVEQNELEPVEGAEGEQGTEGEEPAGENPQETATPSLMLMQQAPLLTSGNGNPITITPRSMTVYVGDPVEWNVSLDSQCFLDSTIPTPAVYGDAIALNEEGTGYVAVAPGVATVTYLKFDLSDQIQIATMTIVVRKAPLETIELSETELHLNVGDVRELTYSLDTRVEDPQVRYTTDKPDEVVRVEQDGTLTALGVGSAMVTVTFTDWNNEEKSATCAVTVDQYPTGLALADGVSENILMAVGGEAQLAVTPAFPEGVSADTPAEITWTSDNEEVATVDQSGKVTAVAVGTATIAATTINDHKVEVKVVVGSLEIERPEGPNILLVGETVQLEAVTKPEGLTAVWCSSDEQVASVDASGLVTALQSGTVTITAYANEENSAVSNQIRLIISPLEPGEGLSRNLTLAAGGQTKQLSLKELPEEFAGATISWLSSNPEVADVSQDGLMTSGNAGMATVSATVPFEGESYSLDFEVTVISLGISAPEAATTVARGGSLQLSADTLPDTYKAQWTSSDETKATVDENGLVTGVALGDVVIKASITVDGVAVNAEYPLTVNAPAEAIAISGAEFDENNKIELYSGQKLTLSFALTPEDSTDAAEWTWEEMLGVKVELSEDKRTATLSAETDAEDGAMLIEDGTEFVLTAKAGQIAESRTIVFRQAISIVEITGDGVEVNEETGERSLRLYTAQDSTGGGTSAQLGVHLLPEGAAMSNITWSSMDEGIVTVDAATGLAKAVSYGETVIRATAENGVYGEVRVAVYNRAEYVTIDPTYVVIDRYDDNVSYQINARTYPDGSNKLFWSSSNESVATVDSQGRVTCVGSGYSIIRARTSDTDPDAPEAISLVKVVQHVNEIRLHTDPFPDINEVGLTVAISQVVSMGITLLPETATDTGYTMVAEDPSILMVAENKMMGLKTGRTMLTITANDASDGKTRSRSILVTVVAKGRGVTAMKLNKTSIALYDGQSYRLKATLPSKASNKGVRFYSEDESICTVNPTNGTVTATGIGETYVHCISSSGIYVSCKVSVVPQKATSVRFTNASSGTMRVGETYQLEAECLPSTITYEEDRTIANWISSKPSVAIVNDEGLLYCVSAGTTYIYAQATSGKYASIKVVVKDQPAAKLNLINTSTNPGGVLYVGGTYRMGSELFLSSPLPDGTYREIYNDGLDAVYYGAGTYDTFGVDDGILMANTKNSRIVWGTSNKKIATVDYDTGVITCLRSGTFDVLACAQTNFKKIYRLRLTVTVPDSYDYENSLRLLDANGEEATQVTMTYASPELATHQLSYALDYSYALEAEWFSEDPRVATVDQTGLVTATGIGETTVGVLVGGFDYREVPVRVERQDGTADVTYRNLTITMYQTPGQSGYLAFMKNSSALVRSAIAGQEVDGNRYEMSYYTNSQIKTKANFVSAVKNTFEGSKEGDVSVIVLMSHGTILKDNYYWYLSGGVNKNFKYVTGADIVSAIQQYVKGHVVVILLSCYSGASTPASSLAARIRALDASLTGENSVSLITSTDGITESGYFNSSEYIAYDFFSVGVARSIANNPTLTVSELGSLTKSNTAAFLAEHKAIYGTSSIGMNPNPIVQLFISDKAKDLVVF